MPGLDLPMARIRRFRVLRAFAARTSGQWRTPELCLVQRKRPVLVPSRSRSHRRPLSSTRPRRPRPATTGRIAARTAETKLVRRNDLPLRLQRARSCAPASPNRTLESPIASQSGTPARPSPVAHIGSRDACEPEKETRTARTHRQTSVRHIHGDACTGRWRGLAR